MSKSNAENSAISVSRRHFLKSTLVGAGGYFGLNTLSGLVVGFNSASPVQTVTDADINAWVHITAQNETVIQVGFSEMGQGVHTALPMLIAEELDAAWSTVRVEAAPASPDFNNNVYKTQVTAGSTSVISSWTPLRQGGAKLRQMLLQAFVNQFGGDINTLTTQDSVVTDPSSGQTATYGDLAAAASQLTPPDDVTLKDPSQWTLIGTDVPRVDVPAKCYGTAEFGIDVDLPNMLIGTVMNCPVNGGTVKSINDAPAMAIEGVEAVLDMGNVVVVVGEGYWPCLQGVKALYMDSGLVWNGSEYVENGVIWDFGPNINVNTDDLSERYKTIANDPADLGVPVFEKGDKEAAAATTLDAVFEVPFLAHAALEPMNATVAIGEDGTVDVWVPTQAQADTQKQVADILGVQASQVNVHTTYLGGAFGRRLNVDFVLQAALAAQAMDRPVKLIWSREEDTRHDNYRPMAVARLQAGLDSSNNLISWQHKLVAPPFVPEWLNLESSTGGGFLSGCVQQVERSVFALFIATEGAIEEASEDDAAAPNDVRGHVTDLDLGQIGRVGLPYNIPNEFVEYVVEPVGVALGFWRAVGPSYNIFFSETMMDEVAAAAGQDAVAFRRALLSAFPRYQRVLDEAASRGNWGNAPDGRFQGVAFFRGFGSSAAQVVEISVDEDDDGNDTLIVHKVTCVVDCGPVINPDIATSQVVGAVVFGLTAALYGKITIEQGRVLEANFGNYRLLPISEMPEVDVHFIPDSDAAIGGLGEVGLPLIAPAIANALRANGLYNPIRSLPIRLIKSNQG